MWSDFWKKNSVLHHIIGGRLEKQKPDSGHFHSLLLSCSGQGHFWSLPAAESPVFSRSERPERGCGPGKLREQTPSHTRTFSEGQSLILHFSFPSAGCSFYSVFFSVPFFFFKKNLVLILFSFFPVVLLVYLFWYNPFNSFPISFFSISPLMVPFYFSQMFFSYIFPSHSISYFFLIPFIPPKTKISMQEKYYLTATSYIVSRDRVISLHRKRWH